MATFHKLKIMAIIIVNAITIYEKLIYVTCVTSNLANNREIRRRHYEFLKVRNLCDYEFLV